MRYLFLALLALGSSCGPLAAQDIEKSWGEPSLNTAKNADFLGEQETQMLIELNMVRSDPQRYIQYIKYYKRYLKARAIHPQRYMINTHNEVDAESGEVVTRHDTLWGKKVRQAKLAACDQLLKELETQPALKQLLPHQGLYQSAKAHADDQRQQGTFDHIGSDQRHPQDRIPQQVEEMRCAGENLEHGTKSVRMVVVKLLVDAGEKDRQDRRNMLNPQWRYVAPHYAGHLGGWEHCWIQHFGSTGDCQ